MKVDDIPGVELRDQLIHACGQDPLIDRPLRVAEVAAVAVGAVQTVNPFRDPKELVVAADRHPARASTPAPRV